MAQRTLGDAGSSIVSLCYAGLHYALLVACKLSVCLPAHA